MFYFGWTIFRDTYTAIGLAQGMEKKILRSFFFSCAWRCECVCGFNCPMRPKITIFITLSVTSIVLRLFIDFYNFTRSLSHLFIRLSLKLYLLSLFLFLILLFSSYFHWTLNLRYESILVVSMLWNYKIEIISLRTCLTFFSSITRRWVCVNKSRSDSDFVEEKKNLFSTRDSFINEKLFNTSTIIIETVDRHIRLSRNRKKFSEITIQSNRKNWVR